MSFHIKGEIVRVKVYQNKKTYSLADLVEVIKPSVHRIKPKCPLFGTCGGCQYQYMKIEDQRITKRQHVFETLTRIGGFQTSDNEIGFPCKINDVVGTTEVLYNQFLSFPPCNHKTPVIFA